MIDIPVKKICQTAFYEQLYIIGLPYALIVQPVAEVFFNIEVLGADKRFSGIFEIPDASHQEFADRHLFAAECNNDPQAIVYYNPIRIYLISVHLLTISRPGVIVDI